ncbi:MAG: L,D-transpeptidase [Actinomycetota bacterium]|nr:L,D-transpeptidase [Actinomycetota bacterium]
MSIPRCLAVRPAATLHHLAAIGLLALVCILSGVTAGSAVAASPVRHVRATQELTSLLFPHLAYRSPRTSSPVLASLPAQTPITGEQTTLPVVGRAVGGNGRRWFEVMLPGRPNSSTGWITQGGTSTSVTGWHIVVSLSQAHMWVYLHGRRWRDFAGVVGKPSTPTPTGNFFVQETVDMPSTAAGGPFALALSARSNALQEFDGGPGQIAIHGRDLLGGTLGQAQSHGCMRLATAAITWLAARIGPGVPVTIRN